MKDVAAKFEKVIETLRAAWVLLLCHANRDTNFFTRTIMNHIVLPTCIRSIKLRILRWHY